jgi:quercetin dioxygenase-like cupin family protein
METMAPADGETVEAVEGVHLTQLVAGARLSMQHFHVEAGASIPAHSHDHEQAGYVARGTLTFDVDGETHVVGAGESYVLPGGEPHAVSNRGEEPVNGIDLFSPPRLNPDWLE